MHQYATLEDTVYFGTGIAGRNDGADIDDVSLTLSPSAVPEIDPASAGSVVSLVGGVLALLERRLRRRGRAPLQAG